MSGALKDRSGWLGFFGVVWILVGVFFVLAGVGNAFVLVMMSVEGSAPYGRTLVPGSVFGCIGCLVAGGLLVVLGLGSILARRWARSLSLAVSALWLAFMVIYSGIGALIFYDIWHLSGLAEKVESGAAGVILGALGALLLAIGVGKPLIMFLFYRSNGVKATCELRDPKVRWTDRYPTPLLAFCILLLTGMWTHVSNHLMLGETDFFGRFVGGATGAIVTILWIVVGVYAVVQVYRVTMRGWTIALALTVLYHLGCLLTFHNTGWIEFHEKMFPVSNLAEYGEYFEVVYSRGLITGGWVMFGVNLGFVIWVRRYFERGGG